MPDTHPERDELLRSLALDELAATISTGQTITPLAYARTAAAGAGGVTLDAPPRAAATTPTTPTTSATATPGGPHALPRITLGRAGEGGEAAGSHDLVIVRLLGEGGMGIVSLARQESLQREVAVKTVRGAEVDAQYAAALLHEAVITGTLEHPGIVPVHALGRDASGRPLMVMKRIEGTCWRDLIADPAHPAWERLAGAGDDRLGFHLEVTEQVCNALHFAHSRGIVHRDVKPENVMIGGFGEVYLLDWGIATRMRRADDAREAGERPPLVGTPAYMAPEMVSQREHTERTDVYLLGATLHEALTGRPRHAGTALYEVILQALDSTPYDYDASVPGELAALCNRATSADPAARPASALEFRQRIREFRRHRSSVDAARAALDRLERLRPMLAHAAQDEATRMQVYRLFAECRFGFGHALHEWPENDVAREGLERALALMAAHELDRGNADSAEAHLAEMTARPPELEARVAALRARKAAEREEAARLQGLAREMDPRVAARARGVVLALMGVLGIGMSWLVLGSGRDAREIHRPIVALELAAGYAAAFAVLVAVFRARLLANRAGRTVVYLIGVSLALTVVHRAAALGTGEPVAALLSSDMLIIASGMLAAGFAVQRLFLWFGLVAALDAGLIALLPQYALPLFGMGSIMTLPVAWLSLRSASTSDDAPMR